MLDLYAKDSVAAYLLRDLYIEKQNAAGQRKYETYSSIYDRFDNDEKISNDYRLLMRDRDDVHETFKDVDPFIVNQKLSYYEWYKDEAAGKHINVSRFFNRKTKELLKKYLPKSMVDKLRTVKNSMMV